jgi:predicted negative regulator of RcsB-dependent stress response
MEVETTQSADTFYKVVAWLHANRKRLLIGVTVAAVIALAVGLVYWKKNADEANANAQLLALEAPVGMVARSAAISPTPLLDLARQYPNTAGGEYAQLLGAETLFLQGKYPEAQQEFSRFVVDHPESALVPQGKMGVAASLEAQAKTLEAIQEYQELLKAYPGDANIVTPAKLTLARLFEEENKPQQALTYYSELARIQNPYDPCAAEARQRGQLLLAKHPELRRMESSPAPAAPFSLPLPATKAPVPTAAKAPAPNPTAPNAPINLLSIPGASSNSAPK